MQYRTVGKSGVKVSEIGFGCGNNAVLMVKAPYEDQLKAVRQALEQGITFFDTAFAYGLGKSEENLGGILNDLGATRLFRRRFDSTPTRWAMSKPRQSGLWKPA